MLPSTGPTHGVQPIENESARLTHDQVTLRVPKAGRYTLAIRGHETFVAPRAGTFTLDFS